MPTAITTMDPKITYLFLRSRVLEFKEVHDDLTKEADAACALLDEVDQLLESLHKASVWTVKTLAERHTPVIQHKLNQLLSLMVANLDQPMMRALALHYADYLEVIQRSTPDFFIKTAAKLFLGTDFDAKQADAGRVANSLRDLSSSNSCRWGFFEQDVVFHIQKTAGRMQKKALPAIADFEYLDTSFYLLHINVTQSLMQLLLKRLDEYLERFEHAPSGHAKAARHSKQLSPEAFSRVFRQMFESRDIDVEACFAEGNVLEQGLEFTMALLVSTTIYAQEVMSKELGVSVSADAVEARAMMKR